MKKVSIPQTKLHGLYLLISPNRLLSIFPGMAIQRYSIKIHNWKTVILDDGYSAKHQRQFVLSIFILIKQFNKI